MCSQNVCIRMFLAASLRIVKKKKKKSTDVENKLRLPRREESGTNWDTGIDGKFFLIKKSKK